MKFSGPTYGIRTEVGARKSEFEQDVQGILMSAEFENCLYGKIRLCQFSWGRGMLAGCLVVKLGLLQTAKGSQLTPPLSHKPLVEFPNPSSKLVSSLRIEW